MIPPAIPHPPDPEKRRAPTSEKVAPREKYFDTTKDTLASPRTQASQRGEVIAFPVRRTLRAMCTGCGIPIAPAPSHSLCPQCVAWSAAFAHIQGARHALGRG